MSALVTGYAVRRPSVWMRRSESKQAARSDLPHDVVHTTRFDLGLLFPVSLGGDRDDGNSCVDASDLLRGFVAIEAWHLHAGHSAGRRTSRMHRDEANRQIHENHR